MAVPETRPIPAAPLAGLMREIQGLREQLDAAHRQLEWFKRQLFGAKSERRLADQNAQQLSLGEGLEAPAAERAAAREIPAHTRRTVKPAAAEPTLFFDPSRVPVEVIVLPNPEAMTLAPGDYAVIGEKVTHRLAQRPGSYVVLRYVRPVIKRLDDGTLHNTPSPPGPIEDSRADVSLLAGMLVDKGLYHLPLYRQHQRLRGQGIDVSRPWMQGLVRDSLTLLEPIHAAQLASIRQSRVIAMDETPIKAGRDGPGKMHAGYFWPVYGEGDEISFVYGSSRAGRHVPEILGPAPPEGRVLLTDGYAVYARYAEKTGLAHAQCWAHTRRAFHEAREVEPERVAWALEAIGQLYAIEADIRDQRLAGQTQRDYRITHAKPVVEIFFAWVQTQLESGGLLPKNPLTTALAYARDRRAGLEVFLTDPEVPIDTNHLERALRAIPMGRRNWLFCWTELGAQQIGILQSLLVTCRLHAVDPFDYLVDVLQRVDRHPAAQVHLLTPRLWKQHFAANPLRSDAYRP
ncbi:MAG: IS66 family transposase [Tepidisphaeraceae bacterium]